MGCKGKNKEKEYLERLVVKAEEAVHFLSNKMKPERERSICAAFLRCLGISSSSSDIISSEIDPPDVIFYSARFEVLTIFDKGSKPHDELRERYQQYKEAKTIDDIFRDYNPPAPLTYDDVVSIITKELVKKSSKSSKYGRDLCATLDALIYIDIEKNFLDPRSPLPGVKELIKQGWRSVSMIMSPYSHVFFANDLAPIFLQDLIGKTGNGWDNIEHLFDL